MSIVTKESPTQKNTQANKQDLSQKNLEAEIFSIPVVVSELERMWKEKRSQIRAIAQEVVGRKPSHVLFFGSGGSGCSMYSGYYTMLHYSTLPVSHLISTEILSAKPASFGRNAIAVGASYSGKTLDTVAARRFLNERNVPIFTIARDKNAELAKDATWSVTYESKALYTSPAYLSMIFVVELCRAYEKWSEELALLEKALEDLPVLMKNLEKTSREFAEKSAPELDNGNILVLGGGCTHALAYNMCYDMFGEYLKRFCAYINYGEFRHGPLEIINPGEPTMMFLLANDGSRPFGEATRNFARKHGARVISFDAAELAPKAHPMLGAFAVYQSQIWLLYYMALRRNIDLNHYKYMHMVPYVEGETYY